MRMPELNITGKLVAGFGTLTAVLAVAVGLTMYFNDGVAPRSAASSRSVRRSPSPQRKWWWTSIRPSRRCAAIF
jgi:hypothetical protein